MTDTKTFNQKLIQVREELKVPKLQYNKFGDFFYRDAEDILEAVKPILKKYDLDLTIDEEIVFIGDRYYVKALATITDGKVEKTSKGHSREPLEKKGMDASQITGSTSSYASKRALGNLFLLDDTKDQDGLNKEKKAENTRGGVTAENLAQDWPLETRQKQVNDLLKKLNVLEKEKLAEAKTYTNKMIKNLKFVGSNDLADELQEALNTTIENLKDR